MEDDVARTLREVDEGRSEASHGAAAMAASWRRLRTLRDGLARERAARAASLPQMPVDRDAIVAGLLEAYDGRARAAVAEAGDTGRALASLTSSARILDRLSPAWRARRDRLADLAASAREAADRLAAARPHRIAGFERDAAARVRSNARANAGANAVLAPLDARVAALDSAIAAVGAGDNHARAALQRWDLHGLVRVGALWRRLSEGEALSEAEWAVYVGDGRDPVTEDVPDGAALLAAVARMLAGRGEPGRPGQGSGRVFDGEWTEVEPEPPSRPAAIPRRRLPPPGQGAS